MKDFVMSPSLVRKCICKLFAVRLNSLDAACVFTYTYNLRYKHFITHDCSVLQRCYENKTTLLCTSQWLSQIRCARWKRERPLNTSLSFIFRLPVRSCCSCLILKGKRAASVICPSNLCILLQNVFHEVQWRGARQEGSGFEHAGRLSRVSVWSLRAVPVHVQVSPRCSGFLLQPKDIQIMWTGYSKVPIGCKCIWLFISLSVSSAVDLWPVQVLPCHLAPRATGIGSGSLMTLNR